MTTEMWYNFFLICIVLVCVIIAFVVAIRQKDKALKEIDEIQKPNKEV